MINLVSAWASSHQTVVSLLIWPVFSAFVTWVFRKHSADEFARLPRPIAVVVELVSGLGVDSPYLLETLGNLFGVKKVEK